MSEANKAVIKRWVDAFNKGRSAALAILDEVVTPDYTMHDPDSGISGRAAMREYVGMLFDGMPDLRMTLDEVLADGDRVIYRFTTGGTHTGRLMGFPPTGKRAQAPGISVARITGGRVAEEWQVWDVHSFFQQLSPLESNKLLARRFFVEVLNKRNWSVAKEICAPDFV